MTGAAWVVAPFGLLVGVTIGALGGGGSILAVPVLVFVAGQAPATATSTSLVVVGVASLAAAYGHWRRGRVRVAPGLAFGALGVAGSVAGAALSRRLDGDVLLLGFAALVLVAAWRIATGCPSCTRAGEAAALAAGDTPPPARRVHGRAARLVAAGTAVGFLTGLFGVGGGFVVVPALALVLRYPLPTAIGTSLLVVAVNAAVALAARAGAGTVDWPVAAVFTAAAVSGAVAGERLAGRADPAALQRAFAALLVAVALYTGARAVAAL